MLLPMLCVSTAASLLLLPLSSPPRYVSLRILGVGVGECGSGTFRYAIDLVDSSALELSVSLELPDGDHSVCFQHKKGDQNSLFAKQWFGNFMMTVKSCCRSQGTPLSRLGASS